jgi:hypothetical protein
MTNVPKSKVSPLQKSPNLQPSPMPFIFGNRVILTYHDGKAVVTMSDDTPLWTKKLALVLGMIYLELDFLYHNLTSLTNLL